MDPEFLKDLFEPFGPVNPRRMFGGLGVFHDGVMIALVADGQLFMKADDRTVTLFEDAGSSPFVYSGKGKRCRCPTGACRRTLMTTRTPCGNGPNVPIQLHCGQRKPETRGSVCGRLDRFGYPDGP